MKSGDVNRCHRNCIANRSLASPTNPAPMNAAQFGPRAGASKSRTMPRRLLREIAQRDHSPWTEMALLELGDDATVMGRNQQAFEMYDRVVQRFPNSSLSSHAQLGRGHALYQLGRYDDAQRALGRSRREQGSRPGSPPLDGRGPEGAKAMECRRRYAERRPCRIVPSRM